MFKATTLALLVVAIASVLARRPLLAPLALDVAVSTRYVDETRTEVIVADLASALRNVSGTVSVRTHMYNGLMARTRSLSVGNETRHKGFVEVQVHPRFFGAVMDTINGFVETVEDAVEGIPFVETAVSLVAAPVTTVIDKINDVVTIAEDVVEVGGIVYDFIGGGDDSDNGGGGGDGGGDDSDIQCPGCPVHWIGDGVCDDACYTTYCSYDLGDCDAITVEESHCADGCYDAFLADEMCDPTCNVASCDFDSGDCMTPPPKVCLIVHVSGVPGFLTVTDGHLHMTLDEPSVRWHIDYVNPAAFHLSHGGLYMTPGESEVGTAGDNMLIELVSDAADATWYFSGDYIVSSDNDYMLVDYSAFDIVKLMVPGKFEVYEDQKWTFSDCT